MKNIFNPLHRQLRSLKREPFTVEQISHAEQRVKERLYISLTATAMPSVDDRTKTSPLSFKERMRIVLHRPAFLPILGSILVMAIAGSIYLSTRTNNSIQDQQLALQVTTSPTASVTVTPTLTPIQATVSPSPTATAPVVVATPATASPTTAPTSTPTPTQSTQYAYHTNKGTAVSIHAFAINGASWQSVAKAGAAKKGSWLIPAAYADSNSFIVDLSRNFGSEQNFFAISGNNGKFIVGGATKSEVSGPYRQATLYTTDWQSIQDFSSQLPALTNAHLFASDYNGSYWLIGTANYSDNNPKLLKFNGTTIEDLTPAFLQANGNQAISDFSDIHWNGSEWLIVASPGRTAPIQGKIASVLSYKDGVFHDYSSLFAPSGTVSRVGWFSDRLNNYWLVAGEQMTSDSNHPTFPLYKPFFYHFADGIATPITAPAITKDSAYIRNIVSDGTRLVIGGEAYSYNTKNDAYLFYFDGTGFTDISSQISEGIMSLETNSQGELLVGCENFHVYLVRKEIAEIVPIQGINMDGIQHVNRIAHDGREFILAGWNGTLLKIAFQE